MLHQMGILIQIRSSLVYASSHGRYPKPLISALSSLPCIISAMTLPVPSERLIPQGPCPAATNTPPSAPFLVLYPCLRSTSSTRVTYGVPLCVTGRKHSPVRTTSSSPSDLISCLAVAFNFSRGPRIGFAAVANGGSGIAELTPPSQISPFGRAYISGEKSSKLQYSE